MVTSPREKLDCEAEESNKRQAILRAAARVFLKRGYRATSMELVAVEANSGRQTVYNQFKSKKALFDATVTCLWEGLSIEKVLSRVATEQAPEQVLLAVGDAIGDFWASEDAVSFARMIIAESIHFPELAQSFFTSGRDPARRAVVAYLSALRDTKAWKILDPDLAAAQLIGLINEPLLWPRVVRGGRSAPKSRRTQIVAEAVQTFLSRYSADNSEALL